MNTVPEANAETWSIRPATAADAHAIERLVRELASYERAPDAAVARADDFAAALGTPHPLVHAFVAEKDGETGGEVVGLAIWFVTFSTWRGRHGIWLEDLYVTPEYRGRGLGRALLTRLAQVAVERGYERLEWNVLDWNAPALGFYRALGAEALGDWTMHRLAGHALIALGAQPNDREG